MFIYFTTAVYIFLILLLGDARSAIGVGPFSRHQVEKTTNGQWLRTVKDAVFIYP